MQCPVCNVLRYSKDWRKSQWTAYDPFANEYLGCRQCDASVQATPIPRDVDAHVESSHCVDNLRLLIPHSFSITTFRNWVVHWVQKQSHGIRKARSHDGALRCRSPLDPKHFTDDVGDHYFDPSNYIYSRALFLLSPQLHADFNIETLGDVVEDWLALKYHRLKLACPEKQVQHQPMMKFCLWIEDVAYYTYWLSRVRRDDDVSPLKWANTMRSNLS